MQDKARPSLDLANEQTTMENEKAPVTEQPRNPFGDSAAPSVRADSYYSQRSDANRPAPKRRFESYRLRGDYEKPWATDKRLRRTRCGNYIIWGFIAAGLALSAFINFNTARKVPKHPYCLVLDDQFSTLNGDVWNREVQLDGFGSGAFDWTTTDSSNTYIDAEGLHIVPTLTNLTTSITNAEIFNGYTLNLTKAGGDGSCTGTTNSQCSIHSNTTTGTLIPPVRSARLNTKGKKSIRYGRVEVVAKMPEGDWLWPAIWMMPVKDTYGAWPASGEIDIAEARGNDVSYPLGGRDTMSSSIHWGPTPTTDAYWRSTRGKALRRTDFSKGFHTFGMEWSESYLYTWVDNPLQQVMYIEFKKNTDMWKAGYFQGQTVNSSLLVDPWSQTGRPNTPFDQPFFLVLDVAVGSSNGYFADGVGNKPWTDAGHAVSDFYKSVDQWYPTWPADKNKRGMTVKSVKMWQQGTCGQAP